MDLKINARKHFHVLKPSSKDLSLTTKPEIGTALNYKPVGLHAVWSSVHCDVIKFSHIKL